MSPNEILTKVVSENPEKPSSEIADIILKEYGSLFKGLRREAMRHRISRFRNKQQKEFKGSFVEHGDKAEVVRITHERVRTLADLIRVCEIDTSVWEVDRHEVNSYESHTKLGEDHKVVPLFQVKAFLKRNKQKIEMESVREEILAEIKNSSPKVLKINYLKPKEPHLLEINIFDLHLGKHTWHEETGEDYDLKIASELFLNCLSDLVVHGLNYGLERILFPIGNDFFNVDNRLNQTSNGTPQSEDTRWQKTFRVGRKLIMDGVSALSQHAPVDIIVVPGNHDFERTFYLGEVLEAVYHNNPNITVNNGANPRKYFHYGNNLIGFTHGKDEKITDLPLIMASEAPELWAATKYREWHLGHIHHKKEMKWVSIQEQKGATVRFMRSLTPPDGWHHQKGYVGNTRSGEAFVWHKKDGLIGQFMASL